MKLELCGKQYEVDDALSGEELDNKIKELVGKAVDEIPAAVLNNMLEEGIEELCSSKTDNNEFTVIDEESIAKIIEVEVKNQEDER